jgi:hypothetical protein
LIPVVLYLAKKIIFVYSTKKSVMKKSLLFAFIALFFVSSLPAQQTTDAAREHFKKYLDGNSLWRVQMSRAQEPNPR